MKIFHLITTINRGGAENHLLDLALAQKNTGHDVFIFYLKGNGYWKKKLESAGVNTFHLGMRFYGDLVPIFKIRFFLRKFNPDILHAHMPPAELYSFAALSFFSYPPAFIISKHNDERFYDGPLSKVVSKIVALKSKKIIAISNAVNAYFTSAFNSDSIQIKTIHYGLDANPYEALDQSIVKNLRNIFFVSPEVILFGTLARLVPQKSLDTLLKAYALYRTKSYSPSKLMIVGAGPLESSLKKMSIDLGIYNHVIWAGFREDIPQIMNILDVFVLTSKYEGFGLVLLEAMGASKPIIATKVSAIPEIVVDHKSGLLCNPENISAIASAMIAMENSEYRNKLGNAGNARLKRYFTINKMTHQTTSFYKQALNEQ